MSAVAHHRLRSANPAQAFARRTAHTGGFVLAALLLWAGWVWSAQPILVTVDGMAETVQTHRRTVGALLLDVGIAVQPHDRITPTVSAELSPGLQVTVERARPYRVLADGRESIVTSWGATVADVLADAGIAVNRYDRILVEDQLVSPIDPLPAPEISMAPRTYDQGYAWTRLATAPRLLRVQRAAPITVDDGSLPYIIHTTATTVGQALREAEITLYLGDRVQPSLGSQVSAGLRIFIERSTPVALQADGRLIKTRTRAKNVANALTELKIGLVGADRITPPLETALYDNVLLEITRVREEIAIEEEIIPFETVFEPDPNLALDTQQVVNAGAPGINRQRFRILYENGAETASTLLDSWVAQEATQRVIAYGQRLDPQTATAADGTTLTYWRKFRVFASSYSASTAGVSRDSPTYGRTYTGEVMRNGIIAVDPRLIPLRSRLYVPGYGLGDALDTGSGVLGRHIDLGYADEDLVLWTRWVDVYLLWPPPPAHQIAWVLPNYPREPN